MRQMLKHVAAVATVFAMGAGMVGAGTIVPGQAGAKNDADNNGYPDVGKKVMGHYTAVYAYDENNWFWDLGDGRTQGSVASIEDLDAATLTTCNYIINYRGEFNNDPYLDNGWIMNNINCSGFGDNGQYNSLIVHQTDPRYTGNPELSIWGTWEYHTDVWSHSGNMANPHHQ